MCVEMWHNQEQSLLLILLTLLTEMNLLTLKCHWLINSFSNSGLFELMLDIVKVPVCAIKEESSLADRESWICKKIITIRWSKYFNQE